MRTKSKLLIHVVAFLLFYTGILFMHRLEAATGRKGFDFVIGIDGDFKAALNAAARTASSGKRFIIFFPNGEYDIGSLTGDGNQMTTITTSNISFIGQSTDSTVIFNRSNQEGISITATLYFKGSHNMYLQDLTVLNKANYGNPSTYSTTNRHVAIMEEGNNIIYKNVRLLSTQDTYYTKGNRTYWEDGEIHGTTDFICGGGDIFFNKCLLYINKDSYIAAPATTTRWGYVFMNCTINGTVNSYKLGRPWNNQPRCVYINTTMKKLPTAAAWGDPMNVVPALFAEYNSRTASGSPVDLSGRRTTYTKNGITVTLNPVLTAEEAAQYTVENVMKGSDNWRPDNIARQLDAPVVRRQETAIVWNNNDSALCWAVFRNGKYFKCVTTNSCDIPPSDLKADYTVRAANSMGGLGPLSETATSVLSSDQAHVYPTLKNGFHIKRGRESLYLRVSAAKHLNAVIFSINGERNVLKCSDAVRKNDGTLEIPLKALKRGVYAVRTEFGIGPAKTERIIVW